MRSLLKDRDLRNAAILSIALVAVVTTVWIVFFLPGSNSLKVAEAALNEAKAHYTFWMKEKKKRTDLIAAFDAIELLHNKMNQDFRSSGFSASIASSASSSGVSILGETYKPSLKQGVNYVQIDVEGEYPSVRSFIGSVVDFDYLVLVDKFSIKVNETGLVTARILLSVHSNEGSER